MQRVHLDHNSTTPLRPEARARWLEVVDLGLGNPSSPHDAGRRARAIVDEARAAVAAALGGREDEIFFTSGATEANNWALFGTLEARGPGSGLLTSPVEHASILGPARALADLGHLVSQVPVDACGLLDPQAVAAAVGPATALVSLQAANNETGAAPDLAALSEALRARAGPRPHFHTDAVQALGRLPVRLAEWGADLASFSAHKVGGPPGIGVLWRARGVPLAPRLHGGDQELGMRPGTENVPGIAAAAVAIEFAVREQAAYAAHTEALTRDLWAGLRLALPGVRLVGPPIASKQRLPNTLCVLVPETDGRVLVTRLDLAGLEVSAGSACASGSIEPSHVLLAMGLSREDARAGLRISVGRNTSEEECKRALAVLHAQLASSRAT